ncbi:MAG: VCBS repeat-containing protein, partial [Gammaproteobacteria bacterium]|nr:VCBS repeat-containing protein [Gammaproteobacteria bacterium]
MRKLIFILTSSMVLMAGAGAEPIFDERTADHIDLAGSPVSDLSVKKLALGDLNKDGVEDIVVARRSASPMLFINVGGVLTQQNARFANTALATNSYDVVIFDANGDTWPDLAFGRIGAVPSLYLNLGEDLSNNWLGFGSGTAILAGAADATMIDAADFNGDLDIDLVMLTSSGGRKMLANDGNGVFFDETAARLGSQVLTGIGKIQLGDVENDGDMDIFGVTGSEAQQFIFMNDGNGNFPNSLRQELNLASLTYIPVGADFNGDDIFDYRVYADGFPPTAFMSLGTFTGDFPDYEIRFDADMIGDNGKHGFAHVRDVDGDGDPDYIMSSIEMLSTGLNPDPRNELNEMVITEGVFSGDFGVFADPEWRTEESYDVLFLDIDVDGNIDLFIAHETRFAAYINDAAPQTVEITGFNPVLAQTNVAATLSVNVNGGASPSFSWSMGDGTKLVSGSDPFVEHTYTAAGRYQVSVTVNDTAGTDQLTFWQVVHKPLVSGSAASSSTIVYETRSGNDYVWAVNTDNDSVTAIDTITNSSAALLDVGDEPASLTPALANELWVINKGDATISIIDQVSEAVVATLDILPYASRPHGAVRSPDGASVYVALEARGEVVRIDTATRQVVATVAVEATPRHLAMNAAGDRLYVSRFITPPVPGESTTAVSTAGGGEVRLVDTASMTVSNTIMLPYNDVVDSSDSARGIPNYVRGVALSPDGEIAVVPAISSNIYRGLFRDGNTREHDRLVRSMMARIDVVAEQETVPMRFDFDDQSQPSAAVFGPTGNHLFLVHESSRSLHVLDVYANQIIVAGIAGVTPRGIALSPDAHQVYVHNYLDRTVSVYDATALMTGADNTLTET